jgi:hypothetical protein
MMETLTYRQTAKCAASDIGRRYWAQKVPRSSRGQGIAEGAVALALIFGGATLGTLLLVNSGVAAYYKQKLCVVSALAANYAASLPDDSDRNGPTKEYTCATLADMGFNPDPGKVEVQVEPGNSEDGNVKAKVTLRELPLVGNCFGFLPEITDTGVASGNGQMAGYVLSTFNYAIDYRAGVGVVYPLDRKTGVPEHAVDVYLPVLKSPKGKYYGHLSSQVGGPDIGADGWRHGVNEWGAYAGAL